MRYEPAVVGPSGQMPDASPNAVIVFGVHSSKPLSVAGVGVLPSILPMKNGRPVMPSLSPTRLVNAPTVVPAAAPMPAADTGARSVSFVETLALNATTLR